MTDRVSRPRLKPPLHTPSSYLRTGEKPLSELLQSGFSEHTVPALWHRIQGQLYQPASPFWRRAPRRWPLFAAMASAATVVALVGLFVVRSNSPLRLSSGDLPAALIAEATPRSVELSDGSNIQVAQQSRLEVVSNDAKTFVTALSRGSATFEVNPKAKRRWVVEVGLTSVEVVGTRFTVTRNESDVTVSVTKGLVLVRGDTVPGGQQRLGAGQALRTSTTLRVAQRDVTSSEAEVARAERRTEASEPVTVSEARVDDLPLVDDDGAEVTSPRGTAQPNVEGSPVGSIHSRTKGAAGDKPAQASAASDSVAPPVNVPLDIEGLFAEADRARQAGDLGRSLAYFERVIATAPRFDPRRGLAAMSVARMTMRSNPARAAAALRATLDGMPADLQENANARLVEAYAKSGQTKAAQSAAQRYLERFPNGRRAEDVRRWAAP